MPTGRTHSHWQVWALAHQYCWLMVTSSPTGSSFGDDHRLEAVAATTLVVLGLALLAGSLLGGVMWALDDSYVGSGGPIVVSDRLRTFLAQSVSNVALSALVLAAGVFLRVRTQLVRSPNAGNDDGGGRLEWQVRTVAEVLPSEPTDDAHDSL